MEYIVYPKTWRLVLFVNKTDRVCLYLLPDQLTDTQKEYKINNMLRKLRVQGLITNKTVGGNKSTWALVKS